MFNFHNPSCIFYNSNETYLTLSWRRGIEGMNAEEMKAFIIIQMF